MKEVVRLEPSVHVNGRVLVWFRGEETPLRVTEDEVLTFALVPERVLEESEYLQLQASGRRSSARGHAARLIGERMYSRKDLVSRLVEKGECREDADAAADWLEEIGALNDSAYAGALVRHYARRGYGLQRIRQELFRRGIPRELWSEAEEEFTDPDGAVDEFLRSRLRGKTPDDRDLKRLSDALLRRGFSWEQVRAGMNRLGAELTEDSV